MHRLVCTIRAMLRYFGALGQQKHFARKGEGAIESFFLDWGMEGLKIMYSVQRQPFGGVTSGCPFPLNIKTQFPIS